MMDSLLVGTQDYAAAYLDDLIIFSHSWQEHLSHLRRESTAKIEGGRLDSQAEEVSARHVALLIPWSCCGGGARAA